MWSKVFLLVAVHIVVLHIRHDVTAIVGSVIIAALHSLLITDAVVDAINNIVYYAQKLL